MNKTSHTFFLVLCLRKVLIDDFPHLFWCLDPSGLIIHEVVIINNRALFNNLLIIFILINPFNYDIK